jgi:hypothetical protein
MHFFLPNYQRLSVVARKKEIWMALMKMMGMTARKNMHVSGRKMAKSKIIRMPTVTKQMKCTVIVDHLCWTQ